MPGHRWYSIFSLSLVAALAGCQTDGSGKYAWNPFSKNSDKSGLDQDDSSFSLPKFAGRKPADMPENETGTNPPIAAEQLERLLEQGQLALQGNRLDDARKAYSEVLNSSPDNATAHHGMAMAADLSQQFGDAEYHYRQALRIRPRDANLLCDIGYSYLLQNRYSEASGYLNHAVEINPQHENAQMNLALLDLRQGNRVAAEARIRQRFGSSLQASQILAQLESRTGASSGLPAAEPAVMSPHATIEQIQEIAARERLEAERRRAMQGIPQDQPVVAAGSNQNSVLADQRVRQDQAYQHNTFDPRTGMPFTQQPSLNSPPREPVPAVIQPAVIQPGSGIMANYEGSGAAAIPNGNAPQNPQQWASVPAGTALQGYQQPVPAVALADPGVSNATPPVSYDINSPGTSSQPMMNRGNTGMNANSPVTFNPGGAVTSSTAAAPDNGTGPGRVIPVHSSGAFQPTPTSGISYGQPVGFGGQTVQMPVNTASVSNSMPMSLHGLPGASTVPNSAMAPLVDSQNSAGENSAQQMSLEGLNAGPGALFPIGQVAAPQSVPPAHLANGPVDSAAGAHGSLRMGNISSPGTNSMINGTMYGQPQNSLPAQEWMNQQQQQQSQQLQGSMPRHAGPPRQESVSAAWPSARPPQSNPLETYDRQLQQLDNNYNNTLQQMDRQNHPANRNLQ